jgi:peptide/nickel transport system ATP-binding protein
MNDSRLLDIKNLRVWYKTYRGNAEVVDGIDMHVDKAEKIGLVGESGCGKTTTMKTVLRLMDDGNALVPEGANIFFDGKDILKMNQDGLLEIRRKKISMISQSPMAALNPVFTVGQQMMDAIKFSGYFSQTDKKGMQEAAYKAITDVMLSDPDRIMNSYPHQLSGGMRQRICIAISLVTPRDMLIADEPGTALDVTVQKQIHSLLRNLVEEKKRSLIMITHSLGVARELVDRVYVMYAGNIVECCKTQDLFSNPLHPYTLGLLECVPRLSGGGLSEGIYGYVPNYINPPKGCRFSNRCKDCMEICKQEKPVIFEYMPGHLVACHKYK